MAATATRPTAPASPHHSGLFLIAVTASFYGDWLTTVGLVVLLYQITGSPAAPAGYVLARVAPRFLGVAPAGALADRFRPTRVIASAWVLQGGLTIAIIPLASARSLLGVYAAVAVAQFLNAIARPSIGATIPRLVPGPRLGRYNGMLAAADSTSVFIAPAVGSSLLLVSGVSTLLLIDGVTFLVGAAVMASLELSTAVRRSADAGGERALDGARVVLGDPVLREVAATFLAGALAVAATQSVLVVAAAERFGGDGAVGWLYSAVGAGALAASVALIKRPPGRVSRGLMAATGIVEVVPLGVIAYVRNFPAALLLLALSAAAGVFGETCGSIDLQRRVPHHLLGRVNAAVFAALYLGMIGGALVGLLLAPQIRWDRALPVASVAGLLVILIATVAPLAQPRIAVAGEGRR